MGERFSIGEVAQLFSISVQTLRYYEKIGLVTPEYVNPASGYRYYSRQQFYNIDRIHYLKKLGLTLKDIREILKSGDVDEMLFFLRKTLDEQTAELEQRREKVSDLQWYIQYFEYFDHSRPEGQLYVARLEERYMLSAPCVPGEPFEDIELRLTRLRSSEQFRSLGYRRHYGFIIDFEDMLAQRFSPTEASIYLKHKPGFVSPYVTTLPAGEYLCFAAVLRMGQWNSGEVRQFFEQSGRRPVFVVANEYEDKLAQYTATPYEIQVYLG